MKKKSNTAVIVFLFILFYMSAAGNYSVTDKYDFEECCLYGFIDFIVISVVMMIVPFIITKVKGKKMSYFTGVKVCLANSLILFVLSCILKVKYNIGIIGGIGAIFFYIINKHFFVDEDKLRDNKKCIKENNKKDIDYLNCPNCGATISSNVDKCPKCGKKLSIKETDVFVCSECGTLVSESAKKCPNCGEKFTDVDSNSNEDKYDKLKKLKSLLDDGAITKEEYNKEKKKLLGEN